MPTADREGLREALTEFAWRRSFISRKQASVLAEGFLDGPLAETLAQADTAAQAVAERDAQAARIKFLETEVSEALDRHEAVVSQKHWFEEKLDDAQADIARLSAEVEALRADKARLDFLDRCNARLNAAYGTTYGWKLVLNHNVNRLMLADMKVDLHDSEGSNAKLPSCRLAIDEALARTALAAGQDKEGGKPTEAGRLALAEQEKGRG